MRRMIGGTLAVAVLALLGLLAWVGGAEAATQINSCGLLYLPGTYKLTQDITPSTGICLEVAADFVTIDLNGFAARGPFPFGSLGGYAVWGHPAYKVTIVRNGTIDSFSHGIDLRGPGAVVDSVILVSNPLVGNPMIAVVVGANATVKKSTIHDSLDAISFVGGSGTAINNVISDHNGQGVNATGQAHMTVTGNTIARTKTGISSRGIVVGNAGTVKDNVLLGVGASGEPVISAGSHATVNFNTVINSTGDHGILVGDHSTVKDNLVNNNAVTVAGIVVAANSDVLRNTAFNNSADGIDVTCPGTVKFNTAFGNTGTNLNESGSGCTNVGNNAP